MNRRGFLQSCLIACAAPAIVRADSLMRILPASTSIYVPDSGIAILVPRTISCSAVLFDNFTAAQSMAAAGIADAMRYYDARSVRFLYDSAYDIRTDQTIVRATASFDEIVRVGEE